MQNRVVDELMGAARRSQNSAEKATDTSSQSDIMQKVQSWVDPQRLKQMVVANPGIALGTAAAVGVLLGLWMKKK